MSKPSAPAAEPADLDPARLFRRLEGARGLIAAVSGGADSTALAVLLAAWTRRPPVLVVTVDHGLRPEAAGEVRLVEANAARLGLPCRVLRAPRYDGGNIQDWARRVRYRLLSEAAAAAGFDTIVTAHHRDDQAETFLLRLARGSGIYGLAAMAEETTVGGLRLCRPLLGVPRQALRQIVAASGLAIAEDSSNRDPRFDRVRLRALMPALAASGLGAARLAGTAARMARASAAVDHYAEALLRADFAADACGVVSGRAAALREVPEEVSLRALSLILRAVGGADHGPRLRRLESLHAALVASGDAGGFKRTLNGVAIELRGGRVCARREWGRAGLGASGVTAGSLLVWDRRFRLRVPAMPGSLQVGPLGRSGRRLRSPVADRTTLLTLPGLYGDGTLLAAPDRVVAVDGGSPLAHLPVECVVGARLRLPADRPAHHSDA